MCNPYILTLLQNRVWWYTLVLKYTCITSVYKYSEYVAYKFGCKPFMLISQLFFTRSIPCKARKCESLHLTFFFFLTASFRVVWRRWAYWWVDKIFSIAWTFKLRTFIAGHACMLAKHQILFHAPYTSVFSCSGSWRFISRWLSRPVLGGGDTSENGTSIGIACVSARLLTWGLMCIKPGEIKWRKNVNTTGFFAVEYLALHRHICVTMPRHRTWTAPGMWIYREFGADELQILNEATLAQRRKRVMFHILIHQTYLVIAMRIPWPRIEGHNGYRWPKRDAHTEIYERRYLEM